ncbi:hypothetical protein KM043_015304 [Ampulex compressa]|nr:hypothetical protein KM043_015304 [Ampulex compressa]
MTFQPTPRTMARIQRPNSQKSTPTSLSIDRARFEGNMSKRGASKGARTRRSSKIHRPIFPRTEYPDGSLGAEATFFRFTKNRSADVGRSSWPSGSRCLRPPWLGLFNPFANSCLQLATSRSPFHLATSIEAQTLRLTESNSSSVS